MKGGASVTEGVFDINSKKRTDEDKFDINEFIRFINTLV